MQTRPFLFWTPENQTTKVLAPLQTESPQMAYLSYEALCGLQPIARGRRLGSTRPIPDDCTFLFDHGKGFVHLLRGQVKDGLVVLRRFVELHHRHLFSWGFIWAGFY